MVGWEGTGVVVVAAVLGGVGAMGGDRGFRGRCCCHVFSLHHQCDSGHGGR